MSNIYVKHFLRFIFLVFFQVFILNNIEVSGYINPYLYILFVLLLPIDTDKWLLLISAFLLGLTVDIFSDTAGMHAAASTLAAFVRPGIINLVTQKQEVDTGTEPSVKEFGFRNFFTYSFLVTSIHHISLFYIEVFRFSEFFSTLYRAVLSVIFTMILILITNYLFLKK